MLHFIDNIIEGRVCPSDGFISGFIEKLAGTALDTECAAFSINISKDISTPTKKKALREHLKKVHSSCKLKKRQNIANPNISVIHSKPPVEESIVNSPDTTCKKMPGSVTSVLKPNSQNMSSNQNSEDIYDTRRTKNSETKKTSEKTKRKKAEKSDSSDINKMRINVNDESLLKNENAKPELCQMKSSKYDSSNPEQIPNNLSVTIDIIQDRIIKLQEDQSRENQVLHDELLRQKHCIDLLLQESKSNKSDDNADKSKTTHNKIQQLADKLINMERKLLTLGNTVEIQTKNLSTLIEDLTNKNDKADKNSAGMTGEINTLRHNQLLIIKHIEHQKSIVEEAANSVSITPLTNPADQESGASSKKHTSDQSTQTDANVNNIENVSSKSAKTAVSVTKQGKLTQSSQKNPGNGNTSKSKIAPSVTMPNSEIKTKNGNISQKSDIAETLFVSNDLKADKTNLKDTSVQSDNRNTINENSAQQSRYQKRKCLFVHDATLNGFDNSQFTRQFDVDTFQSKSIAFLAKDNKFKNHIQKKSTECIFIHVGLQDILNKRRNQDIIKDYNKIMWYLLEETECQIIFSTIIPTADKNQLITKISEINQAIQEMVSEARSDYNSNNRYCLFTYNNNSVAYHNRRLPEGVKLTPIGLKIMWRRLGDGFRKGLRLERYQLNNSQHQNVSSYNRNNSIYD